MRIRICVATLGGLVALAGCATVYEGRYDYGKGWREAEVVKVGTASEMEEPDFLDCRHKVNSADAQFAQVTYRQMIRDKVHLVALQVPAVVAPGDIVYVNIGNCSAPLVQGPRLR